MSVPSLPRVDTRAFSGPLPPTQRKDFWCCRGWGKKKKKRLLLKVPNETNEPMLQCKCLEVFGHLYTPFVTPISIFLTSKCIITYGTVQELVHFFTSSHAFYLTSSKRRSANSSAASKLIINFMQFCQQWKYSYFIR